jgi:hypothetical protein
MKFWMKSRNQELNNLYSSGIISVNKRVYYVARIDNFSRKIHREERRIISECILREIWSEEVNRIHRCNESSVSVNGKYKLCVNYVNDVPRKMRHEEQPLIDKKLFDYWSLLHNNRVS